MQIANRQDNFVTRRVKVDRTRTPQEVVKATKRDPYTDEAAIATMPVGEGEEVEMLFFKLDEDVNAFELDAEYDLLGITPDPYAQAAVNELDPYFAHRYPNGTQWKDSNGTRVFVVFGPCDDHRFIQVAFNPDKWSHFCWFGGVRK